MPARRSLRRTFGAIAATSLLVLAQACSPGTDDPAPSPSAPSTSPPPTAGSLGVYPTFGPESVFAPDVSRAPIDPRSRQMVANLTGQITPHWGGIAALNVYDYNPLLYVVDSSTPRVRIGFDDCQKKGYTPPGLFDGAKQFVDVPVPTNAQVSAGTDKSVTFWSPQTDQLWEFWVMEKKGTSWTACWGGRIDNVSKSRGYFPNPYGVSASGLVTVGSMITIKEAQAGKIDHAMGLALLHPGSGVRYPAQRSDGPDKSPDALPEGTRLRLDPSVNVDALKMTPLGKAIARAAQKHGFIVVDTAGAVAVMTESGRAVKAATGKDPWKPILGDVPNYKQLEGFPWDKTQVIREDFAKPAQ